MSWIKASNKNKEPTKPTKRRLKQKHKKKKLKFKKKFNYFFNNKKKEDLLIHFLEMIREFFLVTTNTY
jgi:hypothetical protein